jgi:hypothetical protein
VTPQFLTQRSMLRANRVVAVLREPRADA